MIYYDDGSIGIVTYAPGQGRLTDNFGMHIDVLRGEMACNFKEDFQKKLQPYIFQPITSSSIYYFDYAIYERDLPK